MYWGGIGGSKYGVFWYKIPIFMGELIKIQYSSPTIPINQNQLVIKLASETVIFENSKCKTTLYKKILSKMEEVVALDGVFQANSNKVGRNVGIQLEGINKRIRACCHYINKQYIKEMTTTTPNKKTMHVRVYRFVESSWTEALTGDLYIDSTARVLKISYENSHNIHPIPTCTPEDLEDSSKKMITLSMSNLKRIQMDESDPKIIYAWVDNTPLSFSFTAENKARSTFQILQLLEETQQIVDSQNQKEETSLQYLKSLIQTNPAMLTTLFINNNFQAIDVLLQMAQLADSSSLAPLTPQSKQNYFLIFKAAIRVGDKFIISKLIQPTNYQIVLKVLSWNPFNKYPFNYKKQYQKMSNINNLLDISDFNLMERYQANTRLRFLRDVATCMFTEIDNQRVFHHIININNQLILVLLSTIPDMLSKIKNKAKDDPIGFLNIIVEIWDIFKTTSIDYENKIIKDNFVLAFRENNFHGAVVQAVQAILDSPDLCSKINTRFHEKWLQSLNTFFNSNWQNIEEWLTNSKGKQCLIQLLHRLASTTEDENLMQIILHFTRGLIEPSDIRNIIEIKIKCYIYEEIVLKLWAYMKNSVRMVELYLEFIMKIYAVDLVRTRRVLIENKVFQFLNQDLAKKSMLICVIKMMEVFLENENFQIFIYLKNHKFFKGLKEEHIRNCRSRNVISSCFRSLLKKIEGTKSSAAREYFQLIFLVQRQ